MASSFVVVWLLPDGVLLASANDVPIFFSKTCFKENPTTSNVSKQSCWQQGRVVRVLDVDSSCRWV